MVVFPNCKINLGLHITGKRADGYHELETVFYPVPLKDMLEVVHAVAAEQEDIRFTSSGLSIPGDVAGNLCIRAYRLLKKDFPALPHIQMHLHKKIPMGAGLGGGSSDGAFTLKLLNEKFQLGLSSAQLIQYAAQLGSDCPFFILNQPCYGTGRGEILDPVQLDLSNYRFVLIHPGIHISTKWAFEQLTPAKAPRPVTTILQQPVTEWKLELRNDFEAPILQAYPEILAIRQALYKDGALYASMSGSGSAVYGIYAADQPIGIQQHTGYPYYIV
ncbi:MAG TPA: 4-(cytidine 5'-diphospho)-2-C-methyl-D-erythritol kinase [Sediminibacterium sp.]|nr:4-(cytidine 5'-diphospho)-2-C-methyl-D-erythritol kinase [Sediminibacterium sp.]